MTAQFSIQSSDPALLVQATRIAKEFASQYARDEIVGIVFLGAIVRGYFDRSSDIDIALFKKQASEIRLASQYVKVEGFEIHCHLSDYEEELAKPWDMAKRWTFSQAQIYYDPRDEIARLLQDRVPLKPQEKKWLLMSGISLSEWYVNRLTRLWVERGNLISAHHMFAQGLNYFFDALFTLNDQLVADMKWRYYCAERLQRLPPNFQERVTETLTLQAFTVQELERRQRAFMEMWQNILPLVENELQMSYAEFSQLV